MSQQTFRSPFPFERSHLKRPHHLDQKLLSWLLELEAPAIRYRTLVDLLDLPYDDREVREARAAVLHDPQIGQLLEAQKPGGYWIQPDYYIPKHYSTFWTLSILADMGLTRENEHISQGCNYLFTHQRLDGIFCRRQKITGQGLRLEEFPDPCTHARIIRFLIQFGYGNDSRTRKGLDWLLNNQREDGMWLCGRPGRGCLRATLDFLRAAVLDPATAAHSATARAAEVVSDLLMEPKMGRFHVADEWTILTYPYFGYSIITALDALARLEYPAAHPMIARAIKFLSNRRLPDGSWPLDQTVHRTPLHFGKPGEPNKWISLDALIALRRLNCI